MHEELSVAKQWEKELEKRLEIAEENVKPSILKFAEEFEKSNLVEESVVEATLDEDELERLKAETVLQSHFLWNLILLSNNACH